MIPAYHKWLLKLPRAYWPAWLQRRKPTKTIECKIWHRNRLNAARVIREYTQDALRDAWGDTFDIRVSLHRPSLPQMSDDKTFGHVREHREAAKDVNAICLAHTDAVGGGSTCKFSVDTPWHKNPDVGDLWTKPNTTQRRDVPTYACGVPFGLISSALHEIGHCLGFGHNTGGSVTQNGREYVSPMPYSDNNCYYLRYHASTIEKGPDVK